jgi:predicted acylesterase/phospholipase RssA
MSEGEVLVDGGVMDNFPAQTMAELCESEHIVGVNVSPYREKKRPYDFETSISGWRILFSRLNPFRRPLYAPSLIGLMMRAVEINSVRRTRESEGLVDLLIHPDVREFGSSEYERWAEISRAGYAAALEPLREWWTTRKPDTANSDRTAAAAPEAD